MTRKTVVETWKRDKKRTTQAPRKRERERERGNNRNE
jgi:hypothetical protein